VANEQRKSEDAEGEDPVSSEARGEMERCRTRAGAPFSAALKDKVGYNAEGTGYQMFIYCVIQMIAEDVERIQFAIRRCRNGTLKTAGHGIWPIGIPAGLGARFALQGLSSF